MKPRQSLSFSILGGKLRSLVLFSSDCGGGRSFKHSRSFLEIKSCMRLTEKTPEHSGFIRNSETRCSGVWTLVLGVAASRNASSDKTFEIEFPSFPGAFPKKEVPFFYSNLQIGEIYKP